ncbi:LOW QUALITY PROTEIN: GRIP and coiled-coil domain-containing protein 2 [Callorhinchus milii]|uniref:LOW QUALITY PROTEIN: GRIP and coiled-coil domain-containing protein 2 n=1 Tax=Callorhinchus milii TaxID=7868 RepID=UPI001C3F98C8|nr:LOW QUALITY PROTEIN: GRIP and coiled-coil domain-containing protein 2 [Callorhinchus milii]
MEQCDGQDGMASPATPGSGKSKLDTLSKEDLIKFVKKQIVILQKAKSKCTELQKEIEELKTQSSGGTDDAVIQELTTRLESVLLEKAESHQSMVSLRKVNEKTKEELKDALAAVQDLQKKQESSENQHLNKIEVLNEELKTAHEKHKEEITRLENELQESNVKHNTLSAQLEQQLEAHLVQQHEVKRLLEEINRVQVTSEEQILQLRQQFEANAEKQKNEITRLQEASGNSVAEYQNKMKNLQEEFQVMQTNHCDEVSQLKEQLESAASAHQKELKTLEEDLAEQYLLKGKSLQDELLTCRTNNEHQLNQLKEQLREMTEKQTEQLQGEVPKESIVEEERLKCLEKSLKALEVQHRLVQDEFKYTTNLKEKLETELNHIKDDFFHEREDWEFKINELQLSKEEYMSTTTKLTEEVKSVNDRCELMMNQQSYEIQVIEQQHAKELSTLEENLRTAAEKDIQEFLLEAENLKKQCQMLLQEKEEAQTNYENLRKNMETLQTELEESASKISHEFEAMKQQQANEVHDLQQKLRRAFSEKDSLQETMNRLQAEVETKNKAIEELNQMSKLEVKIQDLMSSIEQKESTLTKTQEQLEISLREKEELVTAAQTSEEVSCRLKESFEKEQAKCVDFQQQIQVLYEDRYKLQERLDETAAKLDVAISETNSSYHKAEELENRLGAAVTEKEHLVAEIKNLKDFNTNLEKQKALQKDTEESENLEVRDENLHNINEQLESLIRERDDLSKHLEAVIQGRDSLQQADEIKKQNLTDIRLTVMNILEQVDFKYANDSPELDVLESVKLLKESVAKIQEERQSIVLQFQQELDTLRDANGGQQAEFRSLIDDLSKEKSFLQKHLDDSLLDKEGLQRDVCEMQNLSEKLTLENECLLAQVQNATEKIENLEKEKNEQNERSEKQATEGTEEEEQLEHQLKEKDSELSKLKQELESLKDLMQKSSSEENSLQSTVVEMNDKIVALENTSKDKDTRFNKIKAVAVKAKKELDGSKKQVLLLTEEIEIVKSERDRLSDAMKDLIQGAEGYKNLLLEYDKQAERLDMEKERANYCELQVEELTRHMQTAIQQQDQLTSEKEDLLARVETLQSNTRQLEVQILESHKAKSALEIELEGEKLLREQKTKEHHTVLREIDELKKQLQKEKQQLQQTVQELEFVRKDAQQSTLMDMEIADYERFVKELNQKISDRDNRIVQFEEDMALYKQKQKTLEDEIISLQKTLEEEKEKNTRMKQILVKTKKELADSKRVEADQSVLQASIKGELEASQQQVENCKILVAELTAEKHRIQEQFRLANEQNHRTVSALTQKTAALEEERNIAKAEQTAIGAEFESYKVRVHNVLKQQKNRSAAQSETELTKQEREHLEKVIDQLKAKLQEFQCNLQANVAELQALQSEHDTLLERHNRILQETVSKEAELREKLCCVQSENMVLKSEYTQAVSQLTAQNDAAHQSFREQVRRLQEEHRKTVETLQKQLSKMEAQLFQLQSESTLASPSPPQPSGKPLRERRNGDIPVLDINTIDREEGEGMEMIETESVSSSSTQIGSLEQLLNSPEVKLDAPQWQPEPSKDEMVQKLNTATKSIDHLNGLLRETEATNAILIEQITLLKNEVRRLERNQEREKSVANLEYLKNVLLKFIFLNAGSERQNLLPVIDTMLQLSPEERSKLAVIAQGEEENTSRSSGWASYLHSWSGLR